MVFLQEGLGCGQYSLCPLGNIWGATGMDPGEAQSYGLAVGFLQEY